MAFTARFPKLYPKLESKILQLMDQSLDPTLHYHNTQHTVRVIEAVRWLCEAEKVDKPDACRLEAAALFHDTGYLRSYVDHEMHSCDLAREYLSREGVFLSDIECICGLIMATRFPHQPQSHLDQIICDADLSYLGEPDFFTVGTSLRYELISHGKLPEDEKSWILFQVRFLETHQYFTESYIKLRKPLKQVHLNQLKERIS